MAKSSGGISKGISKVGKWQSYFMRSARAYPFMQLATYYSNESLFLEL